MNKIIYIYYIIFFIWNVFNLINIGENFKIIIIFNIRIWKNVYGYIKFNNGNGSLLVFYKINSIYLVKV